MRRINKPFWGRRRIQRGKMPGKPHAPRNYLMPGGISRYSRSAMYRKKAMYKRKRTPVEAKKEKRKYYDIKEVKGDKNGKKRVTLLKKSSRFYPTEDVPRRLRTRKKPGSPPLRKSISAGSVLILLAGRHQGKRVVFLKQLTSGLLLVTGPFCCNGVPLRRINQAYVIASKTKVDVSGVNIPDKLNDDYFRRSTPKKKGQSEIFADSKQVYTLSDERKQDQKDLDSQLMLVIRAVPSLRQYLAHKFTLQKGQYPHNMVF